jgi:hypothetical protein
MKKISILFIVLFFVVGCSISRNKVSKLDAALASLSEEQLSTLETLFRVLMADSQGRYVLYGNKPLCWEAFAYKEEGSIFMSKWIHIFSTKLKRGAHLWRSLELDKFCKNYRLIIAEKSPNEWQDLLLINKNEMFACIEKNQTLFQYALGPRMNAENLMNEIQNPHNHFSSVMHNDKALIGILLGYGTQNAMCCARVESIQENKCPDPSYGFKNTEEEVKWFETKISLSTEFGEKKSPLLPCFGCYDLKEGRLLLNKYKKTQKEIAKILKSPKFLEKILSRIFEKKITLKSYNSSVMPSLPGRQELSRAVAAGIWACIAEKNAEYFAMFMLGLQESEQGKCPLTEEEFCCLRGQYLDDEKLQNKMAYHSGLMVWDHFKKGSDLYSLPEVLGYIEKFKNDLSYKTLDASTDRILTNLHYRLYQMRS